MEFSFLAGNLALDFVATVASRNTVAEEKLLSATDLAEWLVLSGAVDVRPQVSAGEWARAIELRETVYAALRERDAGRSPRKSAGEVINRAAAEATPVPELIGGELVRRGSTDSALALIARAAQEALVDDRLRFCDGVDCTRPFLDMSRAGTRRWCGMSGCGDRAKASAYRRRHAPTPAP